VRFVLYYAEGDVMDVHENKGFDPLTIWGLLTRVKKECGIDVEVVDVSQWTPLQMGKAYGAAIVASVSNRYRIRKTFGTNSSSASFFGKGVPALLVYEGERAIHVFPHEEAGSMVVTIRMFLESLLQGGSRGVELACRMDELRKAIGSIGVSTSELVREGRRR